MSLEARIIVGILAGLLAARAWFFLKIFFRIVKEGDFLIWLLRFFLHRQFWYRTFYLNSNHWKKWRKWRKYSDEAIRHGWNKCHDCGEPGPPLDLHHKTYAHIWHEHPDDVDTLCRTCHDKRG